MSTEPIILKLMPLEQLSHFQLAAELNGTQGQNREWQKTCLIPVNDDIKAIECWLSEYQKSAATYRNYRKEAERLVLWTLLEKKKAFSSLTAEDLLFYSQFLEDPQPREKWCAPKQTNRGKRWTAQWRPFTGALSKASKVVALKSLTSLFNYLTEVQYLAYNPMLPVRRQLKKSFEANQTGQQDNRRVAKRIIDMDEWCLIQDILEQLPVNNAEERWEKLRCKLIFAYGYHGLLRIHEISDNSMGGLYKKYDNQQQKYRWWLDILGKGSKLRTVPVNQSLLEAITDYRQFLKLPEEPNADESEPLLKSLRTGRALTDRRINQLIKEITLKAAEHYQETHPDKAEKLRKFSEHWLRHLSCSVQGQLGFSKTNMKETVGHESERTLDAYYLHTFENLRHEEMEGLSWRPDLSEGKSTKEDNLS